FALDYRQPTDWSTFRAACDVALSSDRATLIELRTDRTRNWALHQELWAAVRAAVRAALVQDER
ncbi:MAG: 2-succinyl-5-enolpyruvyl-6-hydroxy-3-cyclohexene-1-carboxylic-acid synthase, partial [Thermomicrobium sp.]|nr:2-succinyl-5-enolpyruvyl-6-hydroxy-3-cyclohexene-1-carboxylic-acid synthase [Thermomicrobium sp.]